MSAVSQTPGIPHVEADTMFRYSFKILPDRLKLIRLYPCGSLGQSISFVFGARVGHFAATPQSDVVGICSRDLGVMATPSVRQKMPFIRAFITLRSQFHLHHRSQRALTEIVSKITPNLGLVLQWIRPLTSDEKIASSNHSQGGVTILFPSLISLMVSVDVKHHVHLLFRITLMPHERSESSRE